MKKFFLQSSLICIFLIPIAYSQEISEEFLQTLPPGVKGDVLDRIDDQEKITDPTFSGIQSQTKIEKITVLQKEIDRIQKEIKDELDEDDDLIRNKDELMIFGSDFFRTYQSTYMPINEPNLSADYILDFGDTLEIQLVGQKDYIQKFPLQRDGSINLPDIGKVILTGLSLDNAYSLINAKVQSAYIGTQAYVSLSNIRDINVLVSGNAYNPGIYTLPGNSNILHAISVAGGINEFGSYREINLIRNQKIIETLDMYDVLITGFYNSTTSLQPGDTIFVKPVNNIISIDGAVKRPAKYELLKNQKLFDVIAYANGVDVQADESNIYLDRIIDGKISALPISNVEEFDKIQSNDGDKVFIRKHSFRSVVIEGAVLRPGTYLMTEGESVEDLLKKSGGYTSNAYPFGAVYETEEALLINKMAKDILYEEFIDTLVTTSQKIPSGGFDIAGVVDLTEGLKNNRANGRIAIDIKDEGANVILSDKDRLIIPEIPKHIYIYGEVSYEGALRYVDNNDLDNYISKAGGLKETASNKGIYVLHPNGDTQRAIIRKSLFQNNPDSELILYPGSVIFIPRGIDNTATNRLAAQAYVSILGSIGIALASLSSINNN